eukprot:9472801-Pyramimonas_sp.AAC.1
MAPKAIGAPCPSRVHEGGVEEELKCRNQLAKRNGEFRTALEAAGRLGTRAINADSQRTAVK